MINPADIQVAFYRRVHHTAGRNCVFAFRITNAGQVRAVDLRVWFQAGRGAEPLSMEVPVLDPGVSWGESFEWVAERAGPLSIRFALGVPQAEGANAPRVVYSRSLFTVVEEVSRHPENVTYNFGAYQVGDIALGERAADGRKTSSFVDPATKEQGWMPLELIENSVETHRHLFEQMLETAKSIHFRARIAVRDAQQAPEKKERALQLLREALQKYSEVRNFALEVLHDLDKAELCDQHVREVQREVETLFPADQEPERREMRLREYEDLAQRGRQAFSQGRAERLTADVSPAGREEAEKWLRAALTNLNLALKMAKGELEDSALAGECERDLEQVKIELLRLGPRVTRNGVLRRIDGVPTEIHVFTESTLTWGRHSQRDVFVAREPFERPPEEWWDPTAGGWKLPPEATEAQRNYVLSVDMSRDHFKTRWRDGSLEIEDRSSRGTWLERKNAVVKLPKGQWTALAHRDLVHLAARPGHGKDPALTLEVFFPGGGRPPGNIHDQVTEPTRIARGEVRVAHIRRLGNRSDRSFLLLAGEALLGRDPTCALVIEGNGIDGVHAALTIENGGIAVHRLGDGLVMVNDREVPKKGVAPISDGAELRIGSVPFRFRALDLNDPLRS